MKKKEKGGAIRCGFSTLCGSYYLVSNKLERLLITHTSLVFHEITKQLFQLQEKTTWSKKDLEMAFLFPPVRRGAPPKT